MQLLRQALKCATSIDFGLLQELVRLEHESAGRRDSGGIARLKINQGIFAQPRAAIFDFAALGIVFHDATK